MCCWVGFPAKCRGAHEQRLWGTSQKGGLGLLQGKVGTSLVIEQIEIQLSMGFGFGI